jgi:hypothetical protein
MNTNEIVEALTPLVEAFEDLGIVYYVGGSVASSTYGMSRPTQDVDVVADLQFQHARSLVKRLEAEYYIDADAVQDAIRRRSSFNAIHQDTMLKVDIFIPKYRQFAQQERLRARPGVLAEGTRPFYFYSPEDILGDSQPRNDIPNLLKMYEVGKVKLDELVTRTYTLDQVNEAYDDLITGRIIRGVIEF